ncbi:MAG: ribonuclease P protein component [Candidatus Zambryskibacteria bacterium]|nr:ribonuclease P protein component [Candidatus Zambryskibacteria bacterium]
MNHFYLRTKPSPTVRIIISVSKKVSKKAVTRNTIKRRVRAVMSKIKKDLKPREFLIVAKPSAENIKGKVLESEIKSLVVSWLL